MSNISREHLMALLPRARRYARALTGNQALGDQMVARALTKLLDGQAPLISPRIGLYRAITQEHTDSTPQASPSGITNLGRQLLLLTALEGLTLREAALATDTTLIKTEFELTQAQETLRQTAACDILIIEDETIIAMDIEELVQACGHRVAGIAATEADAIAIARAQRPGLILADINLGRGGDGIRAVTAIQTELKIPVIFITAYPERLLTGAATEPAFVLTKPYDPMAVAIATYQAVATGEII